MSMKKIFVKVGHPCQKPPAPFMMTELHVNPGEEIRQAKIHRKFQVEDAIGNYGLANLVKEYGIKFVPSDFYWAIFETPEAEKPIAASDNYYWRQK